MKKNKPEKEPKKKIKKKKKQKIKKIKKTPDGDPFLPPTKSRDNGEKAKNITIKKPPLRDSDRIEIEGA